MIAALPLVAQISESSLLRQFMICVYCTYIYIRKQVLSLNISKWLKCNHYLVLHDNVKEYDIFFRFNEPLIVSWISDLFPVRFQATEFHPMMSPSWLAVHPVMRQTSKLKYCHCEQLPHTLWGGQS